MKPADIKAALSKAGQTQAALARHLGTTSTLVCHVINGRLRSKKVEDELAKLIGRRPFGETPKPGQKKTVWNPTAPQATSKAQGSV